MHCYKDRLNLFLKVRYFSGWSWDGMRTQELQQGRGEEAGSRGGGEGHQGKAEGTGANVCVCPRDSPN